jgi:hypothetical protein
MPSNAFRLKGFGRKKFQKFNYLGFQGQVLVRLITYGFLCLAVKDCGGKASQRFTTER